MKAAGELMSSSASGETTISASSSVASEPSAAAEPQDVNEEHLQQLVDMGFTREHARTALLNTDTIEQATEYALTRAPAPAGGNQVSEVFVAHEQYTLFTNRGKDQHESETYTDTDGQKHKHRPTNGQTHASGQTD